MRFLKILTIGAFAVLVAGTELFAQARVGGDPADTASVTFRCAWWQRPDGQQPPLYVKDGRDYKFLTLFEMAFQRGYEYRGVLPIPIFRKATEAEIEQRKAAGVKKADLEYIPLFAVNPRGMKDIGVILLPGKLENKPDKEMLVFDWSEKSFPYGTIRIANFFRRGLIGQLTPQGEDRGENFRLKHMEIFTSKPIGEKRRIYDIQLAAVVDKQPKVIYSSAAAFFPETRTMIFIIPKPGQKVQPGELPALEFRAIKDRRPVALVPETIKAEGSTNGKGEKPASPRRPRNAEQPNRRNR